MNLDDLDRMRMIDSKNFYAQIERLPDDLLAAWEHGLRLPLPEWNNVSQVVVAGMGQAGIAADLLVAYAEDVCAVPLYAHHNYGLPAFANHDGSLVIMLSEDESSEETQSWISSAEKCGCCTLLLASGDRLAGQAHADSVVWKLQAPITTAGCFGLLLAACTRLGLIPDQSALMLEAVEAMRKQQSSLLADSPVMRNLAKREAGQLMGRLLVFVAADALVPVAKYWKSQVNLLANAWAQVEVLPDANHNTVEGILHPEDALERLLVIFLRAESYHPRNLARADLTRRGFMVAGLNTDTFDAKGASLLAQMLTALHFGDYLAYYLAVASGVDPSDRRISESFTRALGG